MTPNHLLLYRLAELMLEHEQHQLPVDMLFDDSQIGDFVKSIQIDSPYQQMLIEGVLTESVRDEKLYISYTIEGYFFYILGEVIETKHHKSDGSQLLYLIENNKLKGINNAIEELFVRDVIKSRHERIIYFIRQVKHDLRSLTQKPLIQAIELIGPKDTLEKFIFPNEINGMDSVPFIIQKIKYLGKKTLLQDLYSILWTDVMPSSLINCEILSHQIEKHRIEEINQFFKAFEQVIGSINGKYDLIALRQIKNIFKKIGDAYLQISLKSEAIQIYERAFYFISGDERLNKEKLNIESTIALVKKGMGLTEEAKKKYLEIIERSEINNYWLENGYAKLRLSEIYKQELNLDDAIKLAEEVTEAFKLKLGNYHLDTSRAIGYLGSILIYEKKWDLAKPLIEESMKIRVRLLGENNTKTCISYVNYADILMHVGNFSESKEFLEKALRIRIERFGRKHQDVAYTMFKMAFLYELENNKDDSIQLHKEALDIREIKLGPKHLFTQQSRWELMRLYANKLDVSNFESLKDKYLENTENQADVIREIENMQSAFKN